jgi:hypothetical protein
VSRRRKREFLSFCVRRAADAWPCAPSS